MSSYTTRAAITEAIENRPSLSCTHRNYYLHHHQSMGLNPST